MKFVELLVILHILPVDLLPGSFYNDSHTVSILGWRENQEIPCLVVKGLLFSSYRLDEGKKGNDDYLSNCHSRRWQKNSFRSY